jgi:hypothetical protein
MAIATLRRAGAEEFILKRGEKTKILSRKILELRFLVFSKW